MVHQKTSNCNNNAIFLIGSIDTEETFPLQTYTADIVIQRIGFFYYYYSNCLWCVNKRTSVKLFRLILFCLWNASVCVFFLSSTLLINQFNLFEHYYFSRSNGIVFIVPLFLAHVLTQIHVFNRIKCIHKKSLTFTSNGVYLSLFFFFKKKECIFFRRIDFFQHTLCN